MRGYVKRFSWRERRNNPVSALNFPSTSVLAGPAPFFDNWQNILSLKIRKRASFNLLQHLTSSQSVPNGWGSVEAPFRDWRSDRKIRQVFTKTTAFLLALLSYLACSFSYLPNSTFFGILTTYFYFREFETPKSYVTQPCFFCLFPTKSDHFKLLQDAVQLLLFYKRIFRHFLKKRESARDKGMKKRSGSSPRALNMQLTASRDELDFIAFSHFLQRWNSIIFIQQLIFQTKFVAFWWIKILQRITDIFLIRHFRQNLDFSWIKIFKKIFKIFS